MSQPTTMSLAEQARRRKIMQDALTNARLEGLEPDPRFFEYTERFVRGDMTLSEAIAEYTAYLTTLVRVG